MSLKGSQFIKIILDVRPFFWLTHPMQFQDLNTFAEGSRVDISGVADMQNLLIERISDGGVQVSGGNLSPHTVISGRSPARLHNLANDIKPIEDIAAPIQVDSDRAPRGSYKDKMNNLKVPDSQFTIKQLAELNEIPQPYAFNWVKENCQSVGFVPRVEGQRGKSAALYSKL